MDMRQLVGRNFARLRREKGLTQQYLSGLERGQRNPTVITLYELAKALDVDHVELVRPDTESE